jgi:hypothetical protein
MNLILVLYLVYKIIITYVVTENSIIIKIYILKLLYCVDLSSALKLSNCFVGTQIKGDSKISMDIT